MTYTRKLTLITVLLTTDLIRIFPVVPLSFFWSKIDPGSWVALCLETPALPCEGGALLGAPSGLQGPLSRPHWSASDDRYGGVCVSPRAGPLHHPAWSRHTGRAAGHVLNERMNE